jgi:hypothetical protein
VKGAAVTERQVIGAEMTATVDVVAPGLSNALDATASDAAGRDRRRWAGERAAPPGAHPTSKRTRAG